MAATVSEMPPPFALPACPNCGYSLAGLPAEGTCPECGRQYDQSVIVLYGWARGRRENLANAKRSRLVWVVLGTVLSFCGFLPNVIFAPRQNAEYAAPFAIIAVLVLAHQWFRRKSSSHPGLIQVRLTDRECVQYDDLAGLSVISNLIRSHGWMIPLAGTVVLVVALMQKWIGPIAFWFWLFFGMALAILLWKPCQRFRRAIRQLRESDIADANAAYSRPTPWNEVGNISLDSVGADSYRLRIIARNRFLHHDVADAEIRCTAEQAGQLRALLQTWKKAAQHARPNWAP